MARVQRTIFLARRSYRRRRLMDLGRLLPFAGVFLFALPVLWAGTGRTASGMVFVFGAWIFLIICAALLAGPIARAEADPETETAEEEEDP